MNYKIFNVIVLLEKLKIGLKVNKYLNVGFIMIEIE